MFGFFKSPREKARKPGLRYVYRAGKWILGAPRHPIATGWSMSRAIRKWRPIRNNSGYRGWKKYW